MARNTTGILGAFHGRVGTVVGCQIGETFYIRSLPRKRSTALTEREKANHAAFALVQNWLAPLKPVLQAGFQHYGSKTGGFRAALGYNRKAAVAGVYPNQYIDITQVKLSGGNLPGAAGAAVALAGTGELRFTWSYNPHDDTNPFDQAMPVAYNTGKGEAVYHTTGSFRKTGEDTLHLPESWTAGPLHIWLCFIAADRTKQSDSVYLGEVGLG